MTSSSTQPQQQQQQQHMVQLAIYDLSHGMARQLSAQFLGGPQYAIDIIPHTGIVVFGREYFFGGGIQQEDPQHFHQMMGIYPVQMITLGHTRVNRSQFDAWCHNCTTTGRYTMASYDLLTRNCNNFSRDAAVEGLQLPANVFPQWILEIPGKFVSSPMGQMIRPMLENMQVTGPGPVSAAARGGGGGAAGMGMGMLPGMAAPFANAPTNRSAAASTPTAAAAAINNNPWANIPAPKEETSPPTAKTAPSDSHATPILDSFCKPLISTDSKTIALCVKKMVEALCTSVQENNHDNDNDTKKQLLETTCITLSSSTNNILTRDQIQETCHIIMTDFLLDTNNKSITSSILTFVLMFLRVIILQSTGNEPAALDCVAWIQTQLTSSNNTATATSAGSDDDNEGHNISPPSVLTTNHAARAMAWLTLSNATSLKWWWHSFMTATNAAAAKDDDDSLSSPLLSSLTEAALMDLSSILQPRVEVRQAASGFCYNVILNQSIITADSNSNHHSSSNELSDDQVSLLCASLEGIDTEPDATTRLRRLLVAARILVPVQSNQQQQQQGKTAIRLAAKLLMHDLGFVEALQESLLVSSENNQHSDRPAIGPGSSTTADAEKCLKVTKELLGLLQD